MTHGFDAVSLDVGGVLVVPDHGLLAAALDAAQIEFDQRRFAVGHYLAMAAVDAAASAHEDFTDYLGGFVGAVGVAADDRARAHDVLAAMLFTPVWCQPLPGAREGVAALAEAGVRLAITSNSDGTVADLLQRYRWVQVGEGDHTRVEVITDSGIVGVGKPDPAMYRATIDALDLPPDRILHVGDSVHYDVDGAAACGLQSVHMDPYEVCASATHAHVRSLHDVLALYDPVGS